MEKKVEETCDQMITGKIVILQLYHISTHIILVWKYFSSIRFYYPYCHT